MAIKVLVVDDQEDNIELLCQTLEDHDMEPIATTDGRRAFAMALDARPDVIVLDVQMPDMDGYEVCAQLKKHEETKNIPVIFLTAIYSSEKNIIKGLELGAYDYITKPFREGELIARIMVMAKIKHTEDIVRQESHTDPLTGLYNRRFLEKRFSEELSRTRRTGLPLSCIMLDIDHFKSINDTHGHDFGDVVLQETALNLKQNLREYDTIARYGGEEFVVILPSTNYDDATRVAEKIRGVIAAHNYATNGITLAVTISLGVYCGSTREELAETSPEFIRRADEALYKAKGSGRNRVVAYRDLFIS